MNLEELKGKTLDDATHTKLVEFVTDLQGKVQQARDESISHRKGLKTKVEELERVTRTAFDKLGIENAEELEALPDAKGQAEANKQLEAKVKRLDRERQEAVTRAEQIAGERDKERRSAAIAKAVGKHQFVDPDVATMLLEHGAQAEGDQLLFKAEGGKLVPLDEGAAWIAKTKPHLVKAQGGSGSGYRPNGNGSTGGKSMTRAEFEALDPSAKMTAMREKTQLTD
jgi:hypothetical protein